MRLCYIGIFFLLLGGNLFAQNDEIRRRQRAIFIYNFTQQIKWDNEEDLTSFHISVIGNDPVMEELKKMEQEGRTVRGLPIKVGRINSIDAIRGIQVVYLHKRYGFKISEVLNQVKNKNILVVSEDYGFNESMINMIDIGNSFQFEINEQRLEEENFVVSPSLKKLAISSVEQWQFLFLQSTESLDKEREKVAVQKQLLDIQSQQLEEQRAKINEQIAQIDARNTEIERLRVEYNQLEERNEQQDLDYQEKEQELVDFEKQLEEQQADIESRKEEIAKLDRILLEQMDQLSGQETRIDEQNSILREQNVQLNYQRNYTILFIILTISTITAGFFIWRNYRIKKKTNIDLEKKNVAIEAQARELEAQNKEMEQFAYVASHDLQEPLNTITNIVSLIEIKKLDKVGQESIRFISASTDRMKQLIKGLLEYSQIGRDVQFTKVNLNDVMADVKDNLGNLIKETNAQLKVSKLPSIQGHQVQLTLLFQNLISNAIKFRKSNVEPKVTIRSVKISDKDNIYWQFTVKDNGIGIPEEYKEKVFAIFQRLHSRTVYQGTGIGLAHCKKIVDLHRGDIWVESELDKGSTFYFTLLHQTK